MAANKAADLLTSEVPAELGVSDDPFIALDLNDYENFKTAIRPMLDKMGSKKVVSLGEGTHGTSEFYKIRYWITRLLIEEYGFTKVAFESDYADAYLLNESLQQGNRNYAALMKKYLLSIWQHQEVEEMLRWVQGHNQKGNRKVDLLGIDYPFVSNNAKIIQQIVRQGNMAALTELADKLALFTAYQDSVWINSNTEGFKLDQKQWFRNGVNAYQVIEKIELGIPSLNLTPADKDKVAGVLLNAKLAFDAFYQYDQFKRESSRDSCMAEMASWIVRKKADKLVVWAHNIHVGKQESYMNGYPVGGVGKYILQKFPGNYFVMGMGTSVGSFSATTDKTITNSSVMSSYQLEPAITGSLEKICAEMDVPSFLLSAENLKSLPEQLLHRAVGYNPDSGEGANVTTKAADLYDAYLFIKDTSAGAGLD